MSQPARYDEALSSLGLPLTEFRVGIWRVCLGFFAGAGLVFVGAIGLLMAYGALFLRGNLLGLIFAFVGVMFAVLGLMLPWRVLRNRHLRILLGPNGVARIRGGERTVYRWEDITAVSLQGRAVLQQECDELGQENVWLRLTSGQNDTSRWTGYRAMILASADGSSLKLDDYVQGFDRLVQLIQQETMSRLWPSCLQAYRAGCRIPFGVLTADQTGLVATARGETPLDRLLDVNVHPFRAMVQWLWVTARPPHHDPGVVSLPKPREVGLVEVPWEQVAGLQVANDRLFIHLKDGQHRWLAASLLHVPNPHVLLKLARDGPCIPIT